MAKAKVIVSHAGMGSILTAIEAGKPVILMPRRADLGEHRNDHQRDTAAEMATLSNVTVVEDGAALARALNAALAREADPTLAAQSRVASAPLLEAVRAFIWSEQAAPARRGFGLGTLLRA